MSFCDELNNLISQLHCSGKDLAAAAGLSPAVISRYRTGERIPAHNSTQVQKLARGIDVLAAQHKLSGLDQAQVLAALNGTLAVSSDSGQMMDKLNALISLLQINASELARSMNYDTSYLSRIRNGRRRPSDQADFIENVSRFIVGKYRDDETKQSVARLLTCAIEELASPQAYSAALKNWLSSGTFIRNDCMEAFLKALNEFNLDEYIRSIHFDELKVPSAPFILHTSKNYYGLEGMKTAELDFFKATVLSKHTESVFMCSDMLMEDMAQDRDFAKKWMSGLAFILKKGLHLNIVHDVSRPFEEMMLGLESWIPLYMTGQISPFYLRAMSNSVLCHLDYCSGAAALCGECVAGCHAEGKYYLTKSREELEYYRKKTDRMLEKATPLMNIFRENSKGEFQSFLSSDASSSGPRRGILSAPPLYTLPESLLASILDSNSIPKDERKLIECHAAESRDLAERILSASPIFDEVPRLTEEEFAEHPLTLSLADFFYEQNVFYTYDAYRKHLQATEEYAGTHENYSMEANDTLSFRNIDITIREDAWVKISKNKSPAIHFIVRHPKLRRALENMIAPLVETELQGSMLSGEG